jgi:hypothetical protein
VKTKQRKVARGPHAPEKWPESGGAWQRVAALLAVRFQTKVDKVIPIMVVGLVFPLVYRKNKNRDPAAKGKKKGFKF